MKVAIYRRQSLDRSGDELGIDRQLEQCQRLCDARGYEVAEVVTDNSVSASKHGRPGYSRLLAMIEQRHVEGVVILRIDRLMRLNDELEELVSLSERTGVKVITVEGDVDLTTPSGRLVARVLVSVARAEVETKGARHRLANEQKARAGKPHGSRRPFGYQNDLVTIEPSEAATLRLMADKVLAGWSYKEVAHWLNREGLTTTTGKSWYPITVKNMLSKPRYGGIRTYKGAEYPGCWEPVFDTAKWERLQLAMRLRAERANSPRGSKYLLTGLLICGKCGLHLNGAQRRDRPGSPMRRVYNCRGKRDTGLVTGCGGVRRNADALEDYLSGAVFYRLDTPALAELLAEDNSEALSGLLEQRQAQAARIDGLVDDYATGLLSKAQLERAKATAEGELARIDDDIRRAQGEAVNMALPAGQSVQEAWERSESDNWRRGLLDLLIKRVIVHPGNSKPVYIARDGRRMRFDPSLIEIEWRV